MRRAFFALMPTLVVLAAACAPRFVAEHATPGPQSPTPITLRAAWADVGALTPFRVSTAGPGGAVLLTLVYDTLTWKDEHGIIPWLATKWEVAPDGRAYTFTIAPLVTWHDGQPLTADDVAFSFNYYRKHPYRWMSTAIVEGADTVAPNAVRVRLLQPYAPFLEDIAGVVPIIPQHVWSRIADPTTYDGAGASTGSGPFKLVEYRSAEGAYRLAANNGYFRGPPVVQEYQQLNLPIETSIQAVRQGRIDLAWTTDASVTELFKDDPHVKVFATPPLSVVRLAINTGRAPLDDVDVRRAIAYALDRARIAQVVTKGSPITGNASVVPPETPWFDPSARTYGFDPERARALLHGRRLTLELLADPASREPELLQPMLEAIGITLVTKRVDSKTRVQLLREKDFQLGLVQHVGVGGDPDFLRRWYANEEENDFAQGSVFNDPRYAQLGRAEVITLDPVKRKELVFQMQELFAEQLPSIVLYHRRFYWIYNSGTYTPMQTWGGMLNGVPLVQNKLTFLRR